MSRLSFPRVVLATLVRLLPPRFHTRAMDVDRRVRRMTPRQREELAKNLRRMLAPKTA